MDPVPARRWSWTPCSVWRLSQKITIIRGLHEVYQAVAWAGWMTGYRCYWLLHPPVLSHSLWKAPFCRVWLFLISAVLYTPLIFFPFLVIAVTSFCSRKGLRTDKQENSCPVICWQYSISVSSTAASGTVLPHGHQLRKIKSKKLPPNSSDRKRWKKQKITHIEVDTVCIL